MNNEIDETLLNAILQKNSVLPLVKRYEIRKNVINAGSNYCSEIMKLRVEYEIEIELYEKSFILKVPFMVPAYKIFAKNGIFDKESFMYENILPQIAHFVGHDIGPKHYCTTATKSLILEDLSVLGFSMQDRNEQLNFDECKMILTSLANFHAASYHLLHNNAHLLAAVRCETFFKNSEFIRSRLDAAVTAWSIIAMENKISSRFVQQLPAIIDRLIDELPTILSSDIYNFNVLNHGDLWTNNIMFRYDAAGAVEEAKIIDFQNCRWTSPVNDLIIFATTSIKFDVFSKFFDDLLQIYIKSLNRTLCHLGHTRVYSIEELKCDLETAKLFRIVILATYLNITLSDAKNVIVFQPDKKEELNVANIEGTYGCENYKSIICKWLIYLDEHNLY